MDAWLTFAIACLGIFGTLLGVWLGYWLERRGGRKESLEKAKIEVYDRLGRLVGNPIFWDEEQQRLLSKTTWQDALLEADRLRIEITEYLMRIKDFPMTEKILKAVMDVKPHDSRQMQMLGLMYVLIKLEDLIENKTYVQAFKNIISERTEERELWEQFERGSQ